MSAQTTSLSDDLQALRQEWTTERPDSLDHSDAPFSASLALSDARYTILKLLHQNGHSRIYQVRDTVLERVLALKQIDRSLPGRSTYFRQMKERTALNHVNILRIYDIDEQQGQVAMEYVAGRNLREILRLKGALSLDIALYVAIQLVNGLRHAHTHRVIHHTMIPEHIVLTPHCDVKIIAFRAPGSASRKHQPERDDQTTLTPRQAVYMPPEWFGHKKLTVASNVYSFGIIVYEMLCGTPPFSLPRITRAYQNHQTLRLDGSVLPTGLCPILQRCVEVDATRRESDIRAIGEAFIDWYTHCRTCKSEAEHLKTYQDFLLMAWADGKISTEEAAFLSQKRRELEISEADAHAAELTVKQELAQLFRQAGA